MQATLPDAARAAIPAANPGAISAAIPAPDGAPNRLRGHFVLLRAGDLRLLLPQAEVGAAGYLEARPLPDQEGQLRDSAGRPCAALSEQMRLLPECPPGRFIVAALGDGSDPTGWCWDALSVMISVDLKAHALPPALRTPDTPIAAYVELPEGLAFVCSAAGLASFVRCQGTQP
jgi:hypothetical protein